MRLVAAWIPSDALAAPLVHLLQRAEAQAIEEVAAELRRDGFADALARLADIGRRFGLALSNTVIRRAAERAGDQAHEQSAQLWSAGLTDAAGQPISVDRNATRPLVETWITELTARIQGLRNETLERIRDDLETAVLSNARPEELAAKWEREGLPTTNGRLGGRATVIARDQLGSLGARIAQEQQTSLGLVEYMWDARPGEPRQFREVHRARHGERFRWDDPPSGGHPGEAIMCRCRAVAVVPLDRLGELSSDPFP